MRRVLLVVAVAAVAAGCGRGGGQPEETPAPRVPVRIEHIEPGSITAEVTSTGTIRARDDVPIVAEAGGRVVGVPVEVGDHVVAGDVLVALDPELAELGRMQAQAQLLVAQAELDDATATLERTRNLWESGDVADAELESVEQRAKSAEAGAASAEAALGSADRALRNTEIESPVAGTVAFVYAEIGHTVAVGTPVAHVVNDDTVEVDLGLSEDQVADLKAGRPATIRVRALPGESFAGRVEYVGRRADDATKTFPVRVTARNTSHRMRSGMVAEVEIAAKRYSDVIAIERDWIVQRYGEPAVYVAADSVAALHKLVLGRVIGNRVIVKTGLEEGDLLITLGHDQLTEGAAIDVVIDTPDTAEGSDR
jgi:RND family efflux transporter MFP subunit